MQAYIDEWGLKFGLQKEESLPGEEKVRSAATTSASLPLIEYKTFSNTTKVIWIIARLHSIGRRKTFRSGSTASISVQQLQDAENFIVKDVQRSLQDELMKSDRKGRKGGHYAGLNPILDEVGFWVVVPRLKNNNPMTHNSSLQKLLPTRHQVTRLMMRRDYESGHRGRNATLARFRQLNWVIQGSKLAQFVKSKCQMCKLREAEL